MARGASMAVVLAAACLGACGSAGSLLDGKAAQTGPAKLAEPTKPWTMVTLAPVAGVPPHIQDQIARQVTPIALKQNIMLRSDGAATNEYSLRGYLMIDRTKGASKVLYVWDLIDRTGNRVNRVAGEEPLAMEPAAANPWGAVPAATISVIAEKVTAAISVAEPSPRRVAATTTPPSGTGVPPNTAAR